MATETLTPSPSPSSSTSFFTLLRLILIRPRQGFARIAGGSSRAWIILAVLGLALVTLPVIVRAPIQAQQIRDTFAEQDFRETLPPGAEVPEGFDPASAAASPILIMVFPAVGAVLGLLFGWVLWSGALHLIGSLAGGRNSFLQMLRTVIWAWIPYGLRSLLQTIYVGVTGTLIANPGLSGFVTTETSPDAPFAIPSTGDLALRAILQQIDLFLFWNLALLVIGVMVVAKLPRRKAAGIVLGIWVVSILLRVGIAVASGGLAGALG